MRTIDPALKKIDNLINSQPTEAKRIDIKLKFMIANLLFHNEIKTKDIQNIILSITYLRKCTYTEATDFLITIIQQVTEANNKILATIKK